MQEAAEWLIDLTIHMYFLLKKPISGTLGHRDSNLRIYNKFSIFHERLPSSRVRVSLSPPQPHLSISLQNVSSQDNSMTGLGPGRQVLSVPGQEMYREQRDSAKLPGRNLPIPTLNPSSSIFYLP